MYSILNLRNFINKICFKVTILLVLYETSIIQIYLPGFQNEI